MTPPRFRLRAPEITDAAPLAALLTANVSRWVASWPSPCTAAFVEDRIASSVRALASRTALNYVIETEAGDIAGWIGFTRDPARPRCASVGYWLGERHQGQGLMSAVLPVALDNAFTSLDVDTIEAGLQPANRGSRAVLEKCGMEYVGDRMVYASARDRQEETAFFALRRA